MLSPPVCLLKQIHRRWRGAKAKAAASTMVGAWWRSARGVDRFRRARNGVIILQSLYRGGRARREVAARWLALGRRFSRHKAASVIQVLSDYDSREDFRISLAFMQEITKKRDYEGHSLHRVRIWLLLNSQYVLENMVTGK